MRKEKSLKMTKVGASSFLKPMEVQRFYEPANQPKEQLSREAGGFWSTRPDYSADFNSVS